MVADLDLESAAEVAANLAGGGAHRTVRLDVRESEQWQQIRESIEEDFGRLDIAHLNAGVMTRPPSDALDSATALTEDGYRRVMAVNVDGVVLGLIHLLPLVEDRGGDIVITASVAGLVALEIDPLYAASKHALVGLVRSLTRWEDRGIRINAVCPMGVDTDIVPAELKQSGMSMSPPTYIGEAVVEVLESGRGGRVWLPPGNDAPAFLVEPASLQPPQP